MGTQWPILGLLGAICEIAAGRVDAVCPSPTGLSSHGLVKRLFADGGWPCYPQLPPTSAGSGGKGVIFPCFFGPHAGTHIYDHHAPPRGAPSIETGAGAATN